MGQLVIWIVLLEALGLMIYPAARIALGRLPDKGWPLTKPLAALLVGFCVWAPLIYLQFLPYNRIFIVGVILIIAAVNGYIFWKDSAPILADFRARWVYMAFSDAVFVAFSVLMGWLRTFHPQITGTEKFMDQAFISAIMRAQHLPPPDPWLSGYTINYYYLGHFIIATFAKLIGTEPWVAFNIGIAITAGMTAIGVFSAAVNLSALILRAGRINRNGSISAAANTSAPEESIRKDLLLSAPFGLFAVAAMLIFGNLTSFSLLMTHLASVHESVWSWLTHPAQWAYYDWWDPSRAIPNTITEFPDFSFLLSDLHAHVLALPYDSLALGFAISFWLSAQSKGLKLFGSGRRAALTIFLSAMVFGGLYMINGWDIVAFTGFGILAIAGSQWNAHNRVWSSELLKNTGIALGILIGCSFLFYAPFYLGFHSPAQGIGIVLGSANHQAIPLSAPQSVIAANPQSRTAIGDELLANGAMLFIAISWLITLAAQRITRILQRRAKEIARFSPITPTINTIEFTGFSATAREMITETRPAVADYISGWAIIIGSFLIWVVITRLTPLWDGWTFAWSMVVVITAGWLILDSLRTEDSRDVQLETLQFPLLMIIVSAGLIGVCEIVYLRDVFAGSLPRMNTVFKFYYEVWLLLAIVSAPALMWICIRIKEINFLGQSRAWRITAYTGRAIWVVALAGIVGVTLLYPLGAAHTIYLDVYAPPRTLNGLTTLAPSPLQPGDIQAIEWLQLHIQGSPIIVEASNNQADYSAYIGRVSTFTGLPTLMGWWGHEYQWRVTELTNPAFSADYSSRLQVISQIYTDSSNTKVLQLLRKYHVTYVYVGPVEKQLFGVGNNLLRFSQFLKIVYNANGVTIYQVPN